MQKKPVILPCSCVEMLSKHTAVKEYVKVSMIHLGKRRKHKSLTGMQEVLEFFED